jgi:hypothetical protein
MLQQLRESLVAYVRAGRRISADSRWSTGTNCGTLVPLQRLSEIQIGSSQARSDCPQSLLT